ncbi:MAG: hypothetical protein WDZ63_04375 [Burkholderiales bacterium]
MAERRIPGGTFLDNLHVLPGFKRQSIGVRLTGDPVEGRRN